MSRAYSIEHVEAALCVWEWVNECSLDAHKPEHEHLCRYRREHGTVEMRHVCIGLADYCLNVYDLLPDIRDCFTFDWHIVPEIVGTVDWSHDPPVSMPPELAARIVTRRLMLLA